MRGDNIMGKNEIVAMILAGGQGSRLGVLTKNWLNQQYRLEENIEL